ncbi:hypothetical protein LTR37_000249 [Vermiconidia calcicola]|uniref:Uncharacterized protein n=1 Tax=Vermiconidia calcicola TaxID=1690605 RepID=A0ACC3NZY8_9PEZI|nr:hypothetical protein LTR37_000249 [Vermiconidia calcicola]
MPHKIESEDDFEAFTPPDDFDIFTNDDGAIWTLLEIASAENDLDTVQEIVQLKKLRPLGYFITSAMVAIEHNHLEIVATLLQAGLPVGESIVRAALNSTEKYQYLQLFVAAGWDVNTSLNAHTPSVLALASEANDLALVNWLLQELRADVNVECDQLHTPLSVALHHAAEPIVDAMMSQHVRTDKGQLMHYALWRALKQPQWDTRLMDSLLERGAPINKRMYECNNTGEVAYQMGAIPFGAPLHIAVKAQSAAAVEYLLQYGARTDLKDEQDRTPFDLASSEIRQLLQAADAQQ